MILNQIITLNYSINEVMPYINWIYFRHAWGISAQNFTQLEINKDIQFVIDKIKNSYKVVVRFEITEAASKEDDIILLSKKKAIPFLRQQQNKENIYYCLSDFIRPISQAKNDYLAYFVASIDRTTETLFSKDHYHYLLTQTLCQRFVEAAVEMAHLKIRTYYWGYSKNENLNIKALHQEHFDGIRPAIGYPSIPDLSLNFILDELLHFSTIDVQLTENGAMSPHASVSGFIFAHPKATYFSIGEIDKTQLIDYAQRRGFSEEKMRTFLTQNINRQL
jgi:cobalamin-dependent methionine synthase I